MRARHELFCDIYLDTRRKGAAATIISLMPEHPLALNYQRLVRAGTKASLARVTIARQLAAAVLAMWKHQEEYEPQRHTVQGAA